jgi:DNA-binding SARP family transcriptional activator/tetratricopeptide (TPR) repeat protein
MSVKIALLGEVTAQVDQRVVDLGTPRQRCVLAALAVDAGRLVPADRLVDRVWGADTPRRGRAILHNYLSRLRGAFAGAVAIVHRADGYTLEMDQTDQAVDLLRFRALRDQARSAADDTRRVALLTEALMLWRGQPLSGLDGEWVEGERDRWRQERSAAEGDLVDAQLSIGFGDELVVPLSARTGRHPLDERVAGQYMLALHRAGRSADALDHYRRLRERLVEELGTDPSTGLQDLHQRILAADPSLLRTSVGMATPPVVIPRQLPAAPAWFVGRRDELDRLDAAFSIGSPNTRSAEESPAGVTPDDSPPGGMVLISAIGGAGGIGKTWLALTWAHHNLRRFPDGQLFVDLHGFSPTGQPAHPANVLGGFLDALGVNCDRQPTDPDRRAELYRSLIADKRMLVVLDNAATTDQVTPLLPGGHHCTVLVTSRNQLRGLIARHSVRPIRLDVLTDAEAYTLLATTLGADRATANAPAVAELIELCGGFPLALGLIAARAAADPHLPFTDIVTELRALGVEALDSDDSAASLPKVLSWSLRHLTNQQRQVFALLGIAPGPDIGLPAAAALTGLPEREARALLRTLADVSLIDHIPGGRYGMHDLVRAYASTVAADLPTEVRETRVRRVLAFYTHTAYTAERLLATHDSPVRFDPLTPGVLPCALADARAAWAWFDAEHACLLAAQRTATALSWHSAVWHLAWALNTFHYRRGHTRDELIVWQAAANAAVHLPTPTICTLTHLKLGLAHAEVDSHEKALDELHQALALAKHHLDPINQASAHHALARVWELRGDDRQALKECFRSLNLYRELNQPIREARSLNGMGWFATRLGDYDTARAHCEAALTLHQNHHDPLGEAGTLDTLGLIAYRTGRHHRAIGHYHRSVTLLRDHGNTYESANILESLGHPHVAIGQTEQARIVWREALHLYQEQGRHKDAARIRRQLRDLDRDANELSPGAESAD